jgi:hypothetical protein
MGLNPGLLRHWHWQSVRRSPTTRQRSRPCHRLLQPSEKMCGLVVWYFLPKSVHLRTRGRDKDKGYSCQKKSKLSLSVSVCINWWKLVDGGIFFGRKCYFCICKARLAYFVKNCFKQYTSSAASQIPLVAKNVGSEWPGGYKKMSSILADQ